MVASQTDSEARDRPPSDVGSRSLRAWPGKRGKSGARIIRELSARNSTLWTLGVLVILVLVLSRLFAIQGVAGVGASVRG